MMYPNIMIDKLLNSFRALEERVRFLENTLADMGYGTILDPRRHIQNQPLPNQPPKITTKKRKKSKRK